RLETSVTRSDVRARLASPSQTDEESIRHMEIIRNLARRKLRSSLTISGIVIGIFALTTMGSMAEHFNALLDGGAKYFASNIQIGPPDGQQAALLPLSKMSELQQVEGVDAVYPSYSVPLRPGGGFVSFGVP